jgi:hypothetical protein
VLLRMDLEGKSGSAKGDDYQVGHRARWRYQPTCADLEPQPLLPRTSDRTVTCLERQPREVSVNPTIVLSVLFRKAVKTTSGRGDGAADGGQGGVR